ncbi:c-type cytochrome [Herpetosiphon llansteffanensis]
MRTLCYLALGLVLLGCGAANDSTSVGNAERGKRIFQGAEVLTLDQLEACIDCHSDVAGEAGQGIGQNLSNIGNRAAQRPDGTSAIDYLRLSLTEPDKELVGGFQEGIMPRDYAQKLSTQDINDLIGYMLTLKSGID